METSELFRKTLVAFLDDLGHGSQSRIADELKIERRYLNDYLRGRKNFSERKREEIANHLGYSYLEFLQIGTDMFSDESDSYNQEMNRDSIFNMPNTQLLINTVRATNDSIGCNLKILFDLSKFYILSYAEIENKYGKDKDELIESIKYFRMTVLKSMLMLKILEQGFFNTSTSLEQFADDLAESLKQGSVSDAEMYEDIA